MFTKKKVKYKVETMGMQGADKLYLNTKTDFALRTCTKMNECGFPTVIHHIGQ